MRNPLNRIVAVLLALTLTVCAAPCAAAGSTDEPPIKCYQRYTRKAFLFFFSTFGDAQSLVIADPESACTVVGKDAGGARTSLTFTPSMLRREDVEEMNGYNAWRTEIFALTLPKGSLSVPQHIIIPQGALAKSDGTPLPRMQISVQNSGGSLSFKRPSSKFSELLVLEPDADCQEGDVVLVNNLTTIYTNAFNKPGTALFSVQRKDANGTVAEMPLEYDASVYPDSYFFPVAAGTADYTVYACGVPIWTDTIRAVSEAEYEAIQKKDRPLSVAKGLAFIPLLPLFMLYDSGAYAGAVSLALFTWYSPLLVPVGALGGAVYGFGIGAAAWAEVIVAFITGNRSLIGNAMILPNFLFERKVV